ncbi:glucuronate isomerase [Marinilongibacter aquaticus]|uniref:glucuronate isomerase n=1 Tax=Marinilongibacter aquaticus TaxID=2975157 RepID=UPI0021BD682F|nr:glucuronate isomerase [Marinilongibacter aquaticus]UBM58150.1 glucuronate isomerase [Marinilongibacter aquaticus]
MKEFMDENFLLETPTAEKLYHEYAKGMPIIDYHNHLPPDQILGDINFKNLTHAWLAGDHYKWRAMRSNGVNEAFCTGSKSDEEKFQKWAETVPYTMRNPLYHWTHLELQRYFGIQTILNGDSAESIYKEASEKLQTAEFSVQGLLGKMQVETVCTTDDPLDSLEHHIAYHKKGEGVKMFPAFRPDKFILIDNEGFEGYIQKLGELVGSEIKGFEDLMAALRKRADFFKANGCRVCDHGLEQIYATDFIEENVDKILKRKLAGADLTEEESLQYKSAVLHHLGIMYAELGWVQQFHVGALRNNNRRAMRELGPDTGWDSIGDWGQAQAMSKFLGKLDEYNQLAKTVIYNLNPADNYLIGTMIGNFNDGSVAGKVQFGSGWWFLDQKKGMEDQMDILSNVGLISRFVGMLTDSRSFLSFPRHEYFRRILCNLFGNDIEKGELPNDIPWIGQMIQDICYNNTKSYFEF